VARGYDYDIAILSDLRYPGGNSSSIVEEVKAQAAAGYSTALVHVPAGHMKRRRRFNHKVIDAVSAGMARIEPADRPLRVRALVIRQPRVFAEPLEVVPRVRGDQRVLVINHPPFDGRYPLEDPYYRAEQVRDRVDDLFGPTPWAPIGPQVRRAVEETGVPVTMREGDWHNIINVDEWRAERTGFAHAVPVIGRHSRGHEAKWLIDPDEILAAYPEDDRFVVRILGGAEPAIAALGRTPRTWTVLPFGAMSPALFLLGIDFFVYFHHPGWTEAFGRNVIEAMASGVPVIVPPAFEPLLGDTALYGTPYDVQDMISELSADRHGYRQRVDAGRTFVDERFGAQVHARRMAEMLGETAPTGSRIPAAPPRRKRIMLLSPQSRGAGSVVRMLRLARRLASDLEPTMVLGVPLVRAAARAGILAEYVQFDRPGRHDRREWVIRRVSDAIERERPDLVVVDGSWLPGAIEDLVARGAAPFLSLATPGVKIDARMQEAFTATLRLEDLSDRVAVPDPADEKDQASEVATVGPFLPDAPDRRPVPAASPRAVIALASDARTLEHAGPLITRLAAGLRRAGLEPYAARPLIGAPAPDVDPWIEWVQLDPLGRTLGGFDAAVLSASHTLVHDAIGLRVPFVTVPAGPRSGLGERGALADRIGLAPALESLEPDRLQEAFAPLADPQQRDDAARALGGLGLTDGAGTVATLIGEMVRSSVDLASPPQLARPAASRAALAQ